MVVMSRPKDKYEEAVEYFVKHPDEILNAWFSPAEHKYGCLFQFCNPSGSQYENRPDGRRVGCLTMVRNGIIYPDAWTDELTQAIRVDNRLPNLSPNRLDHTWNRGQLEALGEWQRRLDYEIRGVPLKDDEYQCAQCKFIFLKDTPEEEMRAELKTLYGSIPEEKLAIVCDDCFKETRERTKV